VKILLPKLTEYQQDVYDWLNDPFKSGKVAVIKSVRQSGKTFFIMCEVLKMALTHPSTSAIFEPTLALSRNVYKSFYKALENTGLLKIANAQLLEIELTNGSTILFKSTEQINRGLTISGVLVLDECAYLDDEAIYSVLPLINANNAPLLIASTPFTMDGYFYEMFMKGLEGNELIRSFDWSKHPETAKFLTPEKKELYKQTMSRAKYTTEVLGEFLADGGLLFQGLDACLGTPDNTNRIIYLGIDFGTGADNDYTVLSVINNSGQMVKMYRTNNLSPSQQVEWLCGLILDLASQYTIRTVLCEYNSIGSVYIDFMKKKLAGKKIQLTNWTTSNKSKQDLVTNFQIALENGYVQILNDPVLLNELKKYQAEINTKTKTVSYNGMNCHDDTVIATMLAYWAYKKNMGTFSFALA
jgi:PBSX family phage terminase large subunit